MSVDRKTNKNKIVVNSSKNFPSAASVVTILHTDLHNKIFPYNLVYSYYYLVYG